MWCQGRYLFSSFPYYARFFRSRSPLTILSIRSNSTSVDVPDATCSTLNNPVYITTPIFYVNGTPHIGHAYTAVLTDSIARWNALLGKNIYFTTGTDEHGIKVQEAAIANRKTYQEFCDSISSEFRDVCQSVDVKFDDFIRTSDLQHHKAVQHLWKVIKKNGYIYKGLHEGWYSKSEEAFIPLSQLEDVEESSAKRKKRKVIAATGQPVEWLSEENYKFRLSMFEDKLLQWLDSCPDVIQPQSRYNETYATIKSGLHDISISRLRDNVEWAIDVPNDKNHCIYVWFDALTSYLTATGYPCMDFNNNNNKKDIKPSWPVDCHVIGKDILRFHCIYWPAFLIAAGLPLPKQICVHGHWMVDGKKMSKSIGNVINAKWMVDRFGIDPVRFFLLFRAKLDSDADYKESNLNKANLELADTLGNLLARCTGSNLVPNGCVPSFVRTHLIQEDQDIISLVQKLPEIVYTFFNSMNFSAGVHKIFEILHNLNSYFALSAPWALRKTDPIRSNNVIYICMECLRIVGILLQPVIPGSMTQLLNVFSIPSQERLYKYSIQFGLLESGTPLQIPISDVKTKTNKPTKRSIVLFPKA